MRVEITFKYNINQIFKSNNFITLTISATAKITVEEMKVSKLVQIFDLNLQCQTIKLMSLT